MQESIDYSKEPELTSKSLVETIKRHHTTSYVPSILSTDMDPNAVLMGKSHSKIFAININDIGRMMTKFGWDERKAHAYISAVCQTPEHPRRNNVPAQFGNRPHYPAVHPETTVIPLDNVTFFNNSWGFSWEQWKKVVDKPAVYWTKESHKDDPFTATFKTIPKTRLAVQRVYEDVKTIRQLSDDIISFIREHRRRTNVHIWIQGTLVDKTGSYGPKDVIKHVKDEIHRRGTNPGDFNYLSYWSDQNPQDIGMAYGKRRPFRIPIIPWRVSNMGVLKYGNANLYPQLFPSSTLQVRGMISTNTKLVDDSKYSNYSEFVKLIPITLPPKYDYYWVQTGENEYMMKEYNSAIEQGGTVRGEPAVLGTKRGVLTREEKLRLVDEGVPFFVDGARPDMFPKAELEKLQNFTSVHAAKGVFQGKKFDDTTIMKSNKVDDIFTSRGERYIILDHSDKDEVTRNTRKHFEHKLEDGMGSSVEYSTLYEVEDPNFFLGLGSVVTSSHRYFSIGRSPENLLEQFLRREQGKPDLSGHMFASVLAFKSQFLWYLEEIALNMEKSKTIYAFPFKEPKGKQYHATSEYADSVLYMERKLLSIYPHYAKDNVSICKEVVRNFN